MKKWFIALVVVAAVPFVVFAGPEPEEEEQITLRYADWRTAEELELQLQPAFDTFIERHPNVEIVWEQGTGNIHDQYLADMAAGTLADVFMLEIGVVASFLEAGRLMNMMPYLRRSEVPGGSFEDFAESTMRRWITSPGFLSGIPAHNTYIALYYRKSLFDEAGIPYPDATDWTWDEWLDIARALTKDTDGDGEVDQWGWGLLNWPPSYVPLFWANGGATIDPETNQVLGILNSPENAETIEFLLSLAEYSPKADTLEGLGGGWGVFQSGKVATWLNGTWMATPFITMGINDDVGVAMLPHPEGRDPVTVSYGTSYAAPDFAKHPELSAELAITMATIEADMLATLGGMVPSTVSAQAKVTEEIASWAVEHAQYARRWNVNTYLSTVESGILSAFEAVLFTGASAEDALNEAARNIDAAIN